MMALPTPVVARAREIEAEGFELTEMVREAWTYTVAHSRSPCEAVWFSNGYVQQVAWRLEQRLSAIARGDAQSADDLAEGAARYALLANAAKRLAGFLQGGAMPQQKLPFPNIGE